MNSQELQLAQLDTMTRALRPYLFYLTRLRDRMEETHFPASDALYQLVCRTQDVTMELVMKVTYLACDVERSARPTLCGYTYAPPPAAADASRTKASPKPKT